LIDFLPIDLSSMSESKVYFTRSLFTRESRNAEDKTRVRRWRKNASRRELALDELRGPQMETPDVLILLIIKGEGSAEGRSF